MPRILNGEQMIESVRKRTMCPDDTSIFTDDDILDIIDEELQVQVLDKLTRLHGENLTISQDFSRRSDDTYNIPTRALGNTIRDISLVQNDYVYELAQIGLGELPDYVNNSNYNNDLDKFYVINNTIKLITPNKSHDKIRMSYHLRPNFLTKTSEAGVISQIVNDGTNVTMSLSSVGRNFTATSMYDIIGKDSPNKIKKFDLSVISLSISDNTGVIVFSTSDLEDVLENVIVGDYISLAGETPIPNIPTEMLPLLAQAAAIHILEALGDTEALTNAEKRMMKIVTSVQTLIDERVKLAPKKIKPRHGTLNTQLGVRGRNHKGRI